MVFPDLGLPWLPRPPAPARWAASAGAAMAYQALLSTVSLLATGRTITVRLDTGDLVVRVDRFDSPLAPARLAAGRLDDMRLDLSEIRWQGRVFERAEVVLHKVTVGPGPLPMLMAGPIDLAVEVHGTQASDLLAAVQPGLGSRLGDDGKARLWLARRPSLGWMEVSPELDGSGLWVRPRVLGWGNRRLRLPPWTPARAVPLTGLPQGLTVSGIELGADTLVIRGRLTQWRIEMPRARLESIVAALRVTGLPLLNLRRAAPDD